MDTSASNYKIGKKKKSVEIDGSILSGDSDDEYLDQIGEDKVVNREVNKSKKLKKKKGIKPSRMTESVSVDGSSDDEADALAALIKSGKYVIKQEPNGAYTVTQAESTSAIPTITANSSKWTMYPPESNHI